MARRSEMRGWSELNCVCPSQAHIDRTYTRDESHRCGREDEGHCLLLSRGEKTAATFSQLSFRGGPWQGQRIQLTKDKDDIGAVSHFVRFLSLRRMVASVKQVDQGSTEGGREKEGGHGASLWSYL